MSRDERIASVEGFRGVAVLLVVAFHYLYDMSAHANTIGFYPFGDRYAHPVLEYGKTGVQFFFIISGFVIAMTLERCHDWREFAVKRAARLMPGMLICTAITFAVLLAVPKKIWDVNAIDLLPSATLVSEHAWSWLLNREVGVVDGVYWSLFVEAQFYLMAAALYFGMKRVPLLWSLTGLLVVMWCLLRLPLSAQWPTTVAFLKSLTTYDSLPFFMAGVAFHCIHCKRQLKSAVAVLALAIALTGVRNLKADPGLATAYAVYFLLFTALVMRPQLLRPFEWRPLLLIGAASYTIYLLHNRIGVSLTYNLAPHLPEWLAQSIFLPLCMLVLCYLAAAVIDRYWENPMRKRLVRRFHKRTTAPLAGAPKVETA